MMNKSRLFAAACLILVTLYCRLATAGILYFTLDYDPNGLYQLDLTTGIATLVGDGITGITGANGLAPSTCQEFLYSATMADGPVLRTIKINTDGSGITTIGDTNASEGLAYDPVANILYGQWNTSFFSLDPATGLIIETLATARDMENLAFGNGGVYGVDPNSRTLRFYDPGTDSWSNLGAITGPIADQTAYVNGLAYDTDFDILYATATNLDTPGLQLLSIDPHTLVSSIIGHTGLTGITSGGLAYVDTTSILTYTIIDLGTLPGMDTSTGRDINYSGQVTGSSYNACADCEGNAFLYDGSTMHDLGTLPGMEISIGKGINNSGMVAGTSEGIYEIETYAAFLYDGTTMQDLGTLGGTSSYGNDINDSGTVVGYSDLTGDTARHAFLYDGTTMQDLGTLGGTNSYGYAINASGQVAGYSDISGDAASHAFLYDGNTMQDLGTLGGLQSFGYDINDSGQVTGASFITGGGYEDQHAFLYDGNTMHDLGTLGGLRSSGRGINNSGQVVGSGSGGAFLYDGCAMQDLCALVDCVAAGWDWLSPSAINDNGDITGTGVIDGQTRAFLISVALDSDSDGLPDTIEDSNGNGVVDEGETDPSNPDTDSDGVLDGQEDSNANGIIDAGETNPLDYDSDDDGLSDGYEINISGTDPNSPTTLIPGDMNGDGVVNVADMLLLQRHILGLD